MAEAKTADTKSAPTAAEEPAWHKSTLRDYFESICVAVIFALFVRTFIVQAFKIPSKSMEDNLLVGDHILVDKFAYGPHPKWAERFLPYRDPRHCDVMVFKFPKDPRRDFIKRVIGTPADTVALRDCHVIRNGAALEEPYIAVKTPDEPVGSRSQYAKEIWCRQVMPQVLVPARSYFAMGDNRLNSEDSRYWGFVPESLVKGRALLIYWSFDVPPENQQIEVNGPRNAAERAQVFRYTLLHFFDKTRWSRTFRVIRGAELCSAP